MTSEEYKVALAEALRKLVGIMPVGAEWCRAIGKGAPKGGIAYLGQSVTRAMYSDLWDYVQTELADSLIEESEWQLLFASQNGNVPYYSKGDGSTTFRMPCISGYIKGAKGVSEVGQYTPEGLPDANHTHTRGTMNITGSVTSGDSFALFGSSTASIKNTGALYSSGSKATGTGSSEASYAANLYLDASRSWTGETSVASLSSSNPIYGNSSHVTPETVAVLFGVYAIGTVVSIGEATEEGILAELNLQTSRINEVETDINNKLATKADKSNGILSFNMENGTTVELRRTGSDTDGYQVSLVHIAADGTKTFFSLMNDQGTRLQTETRITATYQSGTNWYRKWSDGWIEQGGTTQNVGSDSTVTVSCITAFTTTNYNIVASQKSNGTKTDSTGMVLLYPTSTSSWRLHNGDNVSAPFMWYACGK